MDKRVIIALACVVLLASGADAFWSRRRTANGAAGGQRRRSFFGRLKKIAGTVGQVAGHVSQWAQQVSGQDEKTLKELEDELERQDMENGLDEKIEELLKDLEN